MHEKAGQEDATGISVAETELAREKRTVDGISSAGLCIDAARLDSRTQQRRAGRHHGRHRHAIDSERAPSRPADK